MGFVLMTLLSFVVGLFICLAWASLNSLGVVDLPPSGRFDGVVGLTVCGGALIGAVLQIIWS